MKSIAVLGLKRSGNHAILNWMFKNLTGVVVHLNDVQNIGNDPWRNYAKINVVNLPFWKCKPSLFSYLRHKGWQKTKQTFVYADRSLNHGYLRECDKDHVIMSYEDQMIDQDLSGAVAGNDFRVLVLRDPFNHFASRLQAGWLDTKNFEYYLTLYKNYANHFSLGRCRRGLSLLPANFNQWVSDEEYRSKLAEQLGIQLFSNSTGPVAKEGGGSSFTGTNAQKQDDVLNRWKRHEQHPIMQALLADDQILSISKSVFGFTPASTN